MGVIYYAVNKATGKGYVGVDTRSDDGSVRRRSHEGGARRGSYVLFKRALRKYGADTFVWHVIYESDDAEVLFANENRAIRQLGTKAPLGYNMVDGGLGGRNPCEEVRTKIGVGNRKAYGNPEVRAKLGASMRKAYENPEVRVKMIASVREAMRRPEVRAKLSASMREVMKRPEVREKLSASTRASNYKRHPEIYAKLHAKTSASLRAKNPDPTPRALRRRARNDARRVLRTVRQLQEAQARTRHLMSPQVLSTLGTPSFQHFAWPEASTG